MEEEWKINISSRNRKRLKLDNILICDSNDYKTKNILINSDYFNNNINSILLLNHIFLNYDDSEHYLNFLESEHIFIIENNINKVFTLDNFLKINYNNIIKKKKKIINISNFRLNDWDILSSFKIKNNNNKKILNIFIYTKYLEKENITLYTILTYYDRSNIFLILMSSYIELLLYIYKIECEMGKNPKNSKVISSYPYEFKSLNLNEIKNYFNNFPKVWKN